MANTCNDCRGTYEALLIDLPEKWRSQIADALCNAIGKKYSLDCDDVKECETVTHLSSFTQTDDEICITFKDEESVEWERCFDISSLTPTLEGIDPKCVATQEEWDAMTYIQQIQAIIDKIEDCCCTTTTTSTTTTP
jgi:hypothetical protein